MVFFVCFVFLNFIYIFIFGCVGSRCCAWAFSGCGELGPLFIVVRGLPIAVASLVEEHRPQVCGPKQLWHVGSVVVACGP